jgi:hypothetical protein
VGEISRTVRVPNGAGNITFELYEEDGHICCGILTLKGELKQPPKAWLKTMRDGLKNIEDMAREAGCAEMRIAGRDWSRVFPDYTPYSGPRNGLRKVLI